MALEILDFALVFLRGFLAVECAEVAALAGLRIFLAGIEPSLAASQLADHRPSSALPPRRLKRARRFFPLEGKSAVAVVAVNAAIDALHLARAATVIIGAATLAVVCPAAPSARRRCTVVVILVGHDAGAVVARSVVSSRVRIAPLGHQLVLGRYLADQFDLGVGHLLLFHQRPELRGMLDRQPHAAVRGRLATILWLVPWMA